MAKRKNRKKQRKYNAQSKSVGGTSLGCSQKPPSAPPGVVCQIAKLELIVPAGTKAGSKRPLVVPKNKSITIEVIAPGEDKAEPVDVMITGAARSNCTDTTHMLTNVLYSGYKDDPGFVSEDARVPTDVYYPYPAVFETLRHLFKPLGTKRVNVSHTVCSGGDRSVELHVYPDREVSFELSYGQSRTGPIAEPAETIERAFEAKFKYEKNDGDEVEITLKFVPHALDRTGDDKPTLDKRLSAEIKVNGVAVGGDFPTGSGMVWAQVKDIINVKEMFSHVWDLVRQTYDGGVYFAAAAFGLLGSKGRDFNAQRRFDLSIAVGGEFTWSTKYEHDDGDLVVDVDEFSLNGIVFKPEFKWAFDDVLLSMIPWVGRILAYLNNQARANELGGLEIYVAVSGEVKAGITGRRSARLNLPPEWSVNGNLATSVNLELGVSGKIRIDLVTRYESYEAGVKASSGATAEFHTDKKPDFYNNALEIVLVITKTVEDKVRGEAPHPSKVDHAVKAPESKAYVNKTFTVFDEKQLWGDDD